jgi:patatin-related protein
MANGRDNDALKELRLGVVCYGGSSLAIYMHGVTKEINRLVKASALVDAGVAPAADAKSETFYAGLLRDLEQKSKVRTRVVVDVVAGTSAGGINGVYLTKAIAHNLSQDALRDVWFEKGDMKQLLLLPKSWPVKLRFALLAPRALRKSPLRGNEMAQWLYGALEEMDKSAESRPSGEPRTLMPEDTQLDLFVTVTDFYGYDRQIPMADPKLVHDSRHRHALTFTYGPGARDEFVRKNNGALAFAGRATSCFPGVFPPVSFGAFKEWVPTADLSDLSRCFRSYTLAGADPALTQFVDGGVLDNKPFGWAIGAIVDRRADVEVDRRLLYLQPDPGDRQVGDTGKAVGGPKKVPSTVAAIMGALGGLPRNEPILDDLLEVAAHNDRVARIRDIIETSFPGVTAFVQGVIGPAKDLPSDPENAVFGQWGAKINQETITRAGLAYATYLRLKISGTVDRYAQTVCNVCDFPDDSNHAQLVRKVLRTWTEERGLFQQQGEPTDEQTSFLRDLDLGYGERRLRFVIAALRWWYRDLEDGRPGVPARAELDKGKSRLYDAVESLQSRMGGDGFTDELNNAIAACFPVDDVRTFLAESGLDADAYLAKQRSKLEEAEKAYRGFVQTSLTGFSAKLYRDLFDLSTGWTAERRLDLLVRYMGFPLWDVLLYPIEALADAGENDEVAVQRMSPYEATVLSTPPQDKVEGKRMMHFWAFFDRHARENDYLWGRLDGAAHLIGILIGKDSPDYRATCMKAFTAILDEDESALPHVPERVAAIRAELAG